VRSAQLIVIVAMSATLALTGCSKSDAPPKAVAQSSTAPVAAREQPKACALVTESEMSSILGGVVVAKGEDRPVQTTCTYSPTSGISPYAELKVDWGDGEAGMLGAGMAGRVEPGMTNPLAGIGDQAVMVGPVLMIRKGEDLITIVLSGVDDPLAKAKRIFATASPRM
jgi:hypothetical protein